MVEQMVPGLYFVGRINLWLAPMIWPVFQLTMIKRRFSFKEKYWLKHFFILSPALENQQSIVFESKLRRKWLIKENS